jgi:hypothetical protein
MHLMKHLVISALSLFLLADVSGQKMAYNGFPSLVWPKLYDVTYVNDRDERGDYKKLVISESARALKGKVVVLPGYMVPLENQTSSDRIMLSSLPLNACFFCGVGGPETVVEVRLKKETPYIDQPIEVKGVLKLNEADPDELPYILEAAEVIGTVER